MQEILRYKTLDSHLKELKQVLLSRPFSLLDKKCDTIIEECKKNNVKQFLEVGSFLGASAYIIAKELKNTTVRSIDINDFERYFKDPNQQYLNSLLENYYWREGFQIRVSDIIKIQKFYSSQLVNLNIGKGRLRNLKIDMFDSIALDGDHHAEELALDLSYVFRKCKSNCLVFVDDSSYKHLNEEIYNFSRKHKIDVDYKHDGDLAIMRISK